MSTRYNLISGHSDKEYASLSRSIGQFKRHSKYHKIGITGVDPATRLAQHRKSYDWSEMVVLYKTSSIKYANAPEEWLVELHFDTIETQRKGGGPALSPEGLHYQYVLLKK